MVQKKCISKTSIYSHTHPEVCVALVTHVHFEERVMSTAKEEVKALLDKLPDDCSLEDVQYHLYVVEKIYRGIDRAEKEGVLSQDEVERKLDKWISK